jgi:hypothetical protein
MISLGSGFIADLFSDTFFVKNDLPAPDLS